MHSSIRVRPSTPANWRGADAVAAHWTLDDMPSLVGQTWVVTGANSGLGLETAKGLASKGARVVMACRDTTRGQAALDEVKAAFPTAQVELRTLDLSSLASVKSFADSLSVSLTSLDGLINNAGIMAVPRKLTVDGFESQLGTNHLGHFALTLQLLPLLEKAQAPRVVVVSSTAHKWGALNFDDLMGEKSYSPDRAYGQSKLANLMFAYELQRRLEKLGRKTKVISAHPGYAATNLLTVGPKLSGAKFRAALLNWTNGWLAQSAAQGALPTLFAATSPDAKAGDFYGPHGLLEMRGWPVKVGSNKASLDLESAKKLFDVSESLTHVQLH